MPIPDNNRHLGRARHFRLHLIPARQAVRAAIVVRTSGGQPPSRRSGALARREGVRAARPTEVCSDCLWELVLGPKGCPTGEVGRLKS
jgi:hypothetical protein